MVLMLATTNVYINYTGNPRPRYEISCKRKRLA